MVSDAKIQIASAGVRYFWRKEGQILGKGLLPLVSDDHVLRMVEKIPQSKVMEVYVEDSSVFNLGLDYDVDNERKNFKQYSKVFLSSLTDKDPFPDLGGYVFATEKT